MSRRCPFHSRKSFFVSEPPLDGTLDDILEWMKMLDKFRKSLVDQIVVLSLKLNMSAEYIENMPRLDRIQELNHANEMIKNEQKSLEEMNYI